MSKREETGPRGLASVRVLGRRLVIVPFLSLKYLIISLVLLAAGAFALNDVLLPVAIAHGALSNADWRADNERINRNNFKKNQANLADWVWRSEGMPAPGPKREGTKRILIIGDSFVWGDGYANANDIWWRQFERELRRRGYPDVEIIAAALCGRSTRDELEAARTLVPRFNPDLIIWGYVTNDPDEKVVKLVDPPADPQSGEDGDGGVLDEMGEQLEALRKKKSVVESSDPEIAYSYSEWNKKLLAGRNIERYRETVLELGEFQRSVQVPGFVMTLPNLPGASFRERYAVVRPFFEEAEVDFYDIIDEFIERYPDTSVLPAPGVLGWGINPANGHPGVISTRFYAEKAVDHIVRHYPEVLGRRQDSEVPATLRINDWMPHDLDPVLMEDGSYVFTYPESDEYMLRMPVRRPFVQLNLEQPIELRMIRIEGIDLLQASLDLTYEHPELHFDEGELHEVGLRAGQKLTWRIPADDDARKVNTIRLSAAFRSGSADRRLILTITPVR